jgi:hypothetical protein
MKKTITIAFVLICLAATVFGQKSDPVTPEASYTIDFVFTGEVQNSVDSLFALQYTFAATDVQKFRVMVLEDPQKQCQLNLSKTGLQGDMEVKKEKDKVKVIVHKYDKYDLPVLIQAEDSLGIKYPLYLSTNTGAHITAEEFKAQLRIIRESVKQRGETGFTN